MACAGCMRRRAWLAKWAKVARERADKRFGRKHGKIDNGENQTSNDEDGAESKNSRS